MFSKVAITAILVAAVGFAVYGFNSASGSSGKSAPKFDGKTRPNGLVLTKKAPTHIGKTELASFSAGCFWGVEEQFREQKGVVATAVGFSGGHVKDPSYERVCRGDTGHAETVTVEYDPSLVSYRELLDLFWKIHDPTTLNAQGPDVGAQYRSIIFYRSKEQQKEAIETRDKLQKSGELSAPIVTEIVPAAPFYKAETYHQQYVEKGGIAFCNMRIKH